MDYYKAKTGKGYQQILCIKEKHICWTREQVELALSNLNGHSLNWLELCSGNSLGGGFYGLTLRFVWMNTSTGCIKEYLCD